ncbi:MAG: acetyl-CoA synthetase [Anaerofustis stercorihominis]|nr:acetyl-CoA synthetase [Anaerofustis stercorihominis]
MQQLCYQRFVDEAFDENGRLCKFEFNADENYNFGYDVVDYLAEKCPDKVAMIYLSADMKTEKRFTFGDMKKYSDMCANYFLSLGIRKGDTVMLILKRHYQFWFSIVALHKIGAVVVPATNQLQKKDLTYRFNKANIKAVVVTADGDITQSCDEAIKECPQVEIKVIVNGQRDGWHDFNKELYEHDYEFVRPTGEDAPKRDEAMLMYFTSGTTGYPKLAVHAHTYSLGHIVTARHWHNVDPDGVHFTISETGWGKSVWGKLYGQWFCETAVMVFDFDKFDANEILPLFKKYNITSFCAPTTMYRFFIKEDLSKFDLSSLKYANVAGEAMNPEVFKQFYEATGLKIMEGFGQTETTLTIANLVNDEPKPGSMGKPNPQYHVVICDSEGNECNVGQVGEICIKVDEKIPYGLFMGYLEDDFSIDRRIEDGIYRTGDTAWMDEDGYFWFNGRSDDLIKSSGYRISPFEIESVVMELPYVLECAVTAVPDEIRGQLVKATIVLVKGKEGTDELKKEIQKYVKDVTAPYKYPRVVEFVDALPKTISGKIRRVDIRKQDNMEK